MLMADLVPQDYSDKFKQNLDNAFLAREQNGTLDLVSPFGRIIASFKIDKHDYARRLLVVYDWRQKTIAGIPVWNSGVEVDAVAAESAKELKRASC